jgi:GNAT superfamily N-acetyltransferase
VITIVDNDSKYWDFIRTLRNDPRVREGFVKLSHITHEQQNEYMEKYNENYLIALIEGQPAGYAGSIENDIRVCVHPDFQKRGVGEALIESLIPKLICKSKNRQFCK